MPVHVLVLEALQGHLQVVRQDGDQVDCVQHAASKTLEVGRGGQAQQVLQGEEGDAERFNILTVESTTELAGGSLEQKEHVEGPFCYFPKCLVSVY